MIFSCQYTFCRYRLVIYLCFITSIFIEISSGETGDILATETSASGRLVEKVEWQGTEKGFILITYPKSFNPSQQYHINFWFPGTSGNPGYGIADQNDNYIEICTSYLSQRGFEVGQFGYKHWDLCKKLESFLVRRKGIKVGQRIVSGVSKGGWLAFDISIAPPEGLHGVVIVAAGKSPRETRTPNYKNSNFAVFVCTGETDSNYVFAQMAEDYYKKYHLKDFCYEEWLTKGHINTISPRVIEWLNVQGKKGESPQKLQNYCDTLMAQRLSEVGDLDSPVARYIALRHLLKSPSATYISQALRKELLSKGQAAGNEESVIAWLKDFKVFQKIITAEVAVYKKGVVTTAQMGKIKSHWIKLMKQTKYANIKQRISYGYLRATKSHAMLALQEKEKAKPEYRKMEQELNGLRDIINKQKQHDPVLVKKFQDLAGDLGRRNSKLSLDTFREVEWYNKYTIDDPIMKKLLASSPTTYSLELPYSGASY